MVNLYPLADAGADVRAIASIALNVDALAPEVLALDA
jgi:hypothetical protein